MPLIVDKEAEKKKILAVFHECCKEQPISSVTMREVARKAGINHQKILYYFHSKNDLLMEYVRSYNEIYGREELLTDRKLTCIKDVTHAIADYLYSVDRDNSYNVIFSQILTLAYYDEEIYKVREQIYSNWENGIRRLLERNSIPCSDFRIRAILTFVNGILTDYQNKDANIDDIHAVIDALFE